MFRISATALPATSHSLGQTRHQGTTLLNLPCSVTHSSNTTSPCPALPCWFCSNTSSCLHPHCQHPGPGMTTCHLGDCSACFLTGPPTSSLPCGASPDHVAPLLRLHHGSPRAPEIKSKILSEFVNVLQDLLLLVP